MTYIKDFLSYKIHLDNYGSFYVDNEDVSKRTKTLADLETYLTEREKRLAKSGKEKFERIPAIANRWGKYIKCQITSITDDGEAWVSSAKGERWKTRIYNLLEDTPENWQRLNEIDSLTQRMDALRRATTGIKINTHDNN